MLLSFGESGLLEYLDAWKICFSCSSWIGLSVTDSIFDFQIQFEITYNMVEMILNNKLEVGLIVSSIL